MNTTRKITIQPGDTLTAIAADIGCTLRQIADLNPQVANVNFIRAGAELTVPETRSRSTQLLQDTAAMLKAKQTGKVTLVPLKDGGHLLYLPAEVSHLDLVDASLHIGHTREVGRG